MFNIFSPLTTECQHKVINIYFIPLISFQYIFFLKMCVLETDWWQNKVWPLSGVWNLVGAVKLMVFHNWKSGILAWRKSSWYEWIDASRHPLCRFESRFSLFVHSHFCCSEIVIWRKACLNLNKNVLCGLLKPSYKTAPLNFAKGCVEILIWFWLCFLGKRLVAILEWTHMEILERNSAYFWFLYEMEINRKQKV